MVCEAIAHSGKVWLTVKSVNLSSADKHSYVGVFRFKAQCILIGDAIGELFFDGNSSVVITYIKVIGADFLTAGKSPAFRKAVNLLMDRDLSVSGQGHTNKD